MIISSCFIEMDGRVFALLRFSLLVFFVEANSPLDGQVAMSTCLCPIVILPMLSPHVIPLVYPPHVILLMLSPSWTIVFKPGPLLSNHRWKRPQTTAFSTHPCKKTKPWRCHSHPHIFMKTLQQVCETALTSQYGTLFCLFAFLTVFLLPQLTPF